MTETEKDTLPKQFDHDQVETALYEKWESAGCFKPSGVGEPYCIVIPPPNVTGSLHMGHALNNTLQDILIRYHRMGGKDVLWQVGTDHAGIATQMVVERQMMERQEPGRREIGREAFVEKVWAWKAESAGTIQRQLRRLGASCDWSRERFTMDEGLSDAVRKVFVQLYKDGLIYRDKRLVNWDPKFLTAISDLEVETNEVNGHMWHFAYPLVDGEVDGISEIVIATTRPETMLGDGAVAVHPDDERYKNLIGKMVRIPVGGRTIPIIADEYPDPEFGSGAVKITGAHDFNDYEVAKRHDLPMIVLMDERARLRDIEEVPAEYRGLDRYDARKAIIEKIDGDGLLRKIEDKLIQQPFGDRSGVVLEPMLTDQWYVDAKTLAGPALDAVREGDAKFIPENWTKTYYNWLENIQPWCISRQLWWGHQIPVWYGPDDHVFCAEDEAAAKKQAKAHYGKDVALRQDPDVLDTWFSSALWPFSTLGWPEETPELKRYYPTAVLSTAFDIIFFWVARMMMMGLYFRKEIPFRDIYIHALVRDEHGQKMSKSKGNVIDPLELMDEFGTDSLRFSLASMAAQGSDIRLSNSQVEAGRKFRTKLWNAARFNQMQGCACDPDFDPISVKLQLNQWILHEAALAEKAISNGIEAYRFNEASSAVYQFTWSIYCDWFIELSKPVLMGDDEAARDETRATAAYVFDRILTMLHPFMPFVTEDLWGQLADRDGFLMQASWEGPTINNPEAAANISYIIKVISEIRSVRAEMNVPAGARLPLFAVSPRADTKDCLTTFQELIDRLARITDIEIVSEPPEGAVQLVIEGETFALKIGDVVDLKAEAQRLQTEIKKVEGEIAKVDAKLSNEAFVNKAPAAVVEENRQRKTAFLADLEKLSAALTRFENTK